METLTKRQREALEAIQRYRQGHGHVPTVRELGVVLGLSPSCSVQYYLEILQRKGYVRRPPGKARCLTVARHQRA